MFRSEHVPCLAEMHEESALRAAPWNLDGAQQKRNLLAACPDLAVNHDGQQQPSSWSLFCMLSIAT